MKVKEYIEAIRKKFSTEDKAGLYVTVIFHLAVIIVLLAGGLTSALTSESSYLFDFSRQEEEERLAEEAAFKEEISRRLDELIYGDADLAPAPAESEIRNIAVDASTLRDDRNTDAEELYADAERLRNELRNGTRSAAEEDMENEAVDPGNNPSDNIDTGDNGYRGPSVISYSLDGRKASRLSIPAYRCIGGGDVTVIISVDNSGNVVNARIHDDVSSDDRCLREFALRAARLSRFSSSSTAPLRQKGEIVYRFIPQ